jgi:hypothetical protein
VSKTKVISVPRVAVSLKLAEDVHVAIKARTRELSRVSGRFVSVNEFVGDALRRALKLRK